MRQYEPGSNSRGRSNIERHESIGHDTVFMHRGSFIDKAGSEMNQTSPHSMKPMNLISKLSEIQRQESNMAVSKIGNTINTQNRSEQMSRNLTGHQPNFSASIIEIERVHQDNEENQNYGRRTMVKNVYKTSHRGQSNQISGQRSANSPTGISSFSNNYNQVPQITKPTEVILESNSIREANLHTNHHSGRADNK